MKKIKYNILSPLLSKVLSEKDDIYPDNILLRENVIHINLTTCTKLTKIHLYIYKTATILSTSHRQQKKIKWMLKKIVDDNDKE